MKRFLLVSDFEYNSISYKKKITSDRITYECNPKVRKSDFPKYYSIPYAKPIAVGMLFLMLFLVN